MGNNYIGLFIRTAKMFLLKMETLHFIVINTVQKLMIYK